MNERIETMPDLTQDEVLSADLAKRLVVHEIVVEEAHPGITQDHPQVRFVPLEKLTAPDTDAKHGQYYADHYWAVHPEKGAVFFGQTPQANRSPQVEATLLEMYPWAEVRLIPVAFLPNERSRW